MKTITILMSTYNGEQYLQEQLESIFVQKNVDLRILVRDDGSTDSTHEILSNYAKSNKLKWYTGKNLKSAKSFMNLIENAPDSEYYAFADQDDVWNNNKLETAIEQLENIKDKNDIPKLYCSNYQLVDSKLNELPDSGHVTTTTFNAALVSSSCTGCTIVFNKKLLEFLKKGNPNNILMHDDWVHKVCLAVGGSVIFDKNKTLKYRQHGNNVDGGIHNWKSRIKKIIYRMKTKECIRSKQIQDLIKIYKNDMPENNLNMANRLAMYSTESLLKRISLAFDSKIITPYEKLNRGYRFAIILKYF